MADPIAGQSSWAGRVLRTAWPACAGWVLLSGLHLALFMAVFLWLAGLAGLPRRTRAWLGLGLAVAYAFICGLPVPCLRALVLFSGVLLAQALDLDSDAATSLAAT